MNRRLKEFFPPLRSLALMSLTAATIGGLPFMPCSAQGVWAESDCGAEVACGAEISCGAEPACGVEVSCGCETSTRCEAARCETLGPEKGLLANARLPRRGLIHGTLNVVAGGIEQIITLRPRAHHSSRASCGCSHHQQPIQGQFAVADEAPCTHCQPKLATDVPSVSAEVPKPADSQSELEREWAKPPSATDEQPAPDENTPPGTTFDGLNDPFEDDSASHTAAGKTRVMQTTFASEIRASSAGRVSAPQQPNKDYADYFRK